eukprot:5151224-Prymnesium_polylepis.1
MGATQKPRCKGTLRGRATGTVLSRSALVGHNSRVASATMACFVRHVSTITTAVQAATAFKAPP